jgi:hypothetical protein
MTHDYKRHGATTLFAALNVVDLQVAIASSLTQIPIPNPSSGPPTQSAFSPLSNAGSKC